MNWDNNIIECNIWCYKDPEAEEKLDIDMGGLWLAGMLDLEKACFVKTVGEDTKYEEIKHKGVIYYDSTTGVVTDIDYEDLKIMFDKVNNYILVVPPIDKI